MKAMIFAAGLGTRLQPITNNKPKALVEVKGTPLIEIVIKKLISSGFDEIIVNVHHFADLVIDFLKKNNNFGIRIEISDERDLLLETGGGLKKAAWFFNDHKAFLVYNVDILSNIDLKEFYSFHNKTNSIATLAVSNRETSRYLFFNSDNALCGWKNAITKKVIMSRPKETELFPVAFSGIHIMSPKIFDLINQQGKFSIIKTYLELAETHKISSYNHDKTIWMDLGKKENLIEAEQMIDKIKGTLC